jgi:hypothetical protein
MGTREPKLTQVSTSEDAGKINAKILKGSSWYLDFKARTTLE